MEDVWYNNPKILFAKDKVFDFWPTELQDEHERINNTARFIIYSTVIVYLIRRDIRIFFIGALILAMLSVMGKNGMIADKRARPTIADGTKPIPFIRPSCQLPTENNPMANVLLSDYLDDPDRPSACFYPTVEPLVKRYLDETFATDQADIWGSRNLASRTFYSTASTRIPSNQTDFAEACYGMKNAPFCKDGAQQMCNPNARGVQLEALSGLDGAGNPRF